MYPSYANGPPMGTPHHHLLHNHSSLTFDAMMQQRYVYSNTRLRNAITHSPLHSQSQQHCSKLVEYLRVCRHLFVHTYVHLEYCCQSQATRSADKSRRLSQLEDRAKYWSGWHSIEQLARHSLIRDELFALGAGFPCSQHTLLFAQHHLIPDDDHDLVSLLLHCGKKPELYELATQPRRNGLRESVQVIELLWKFLLRNQESEESVTVTRRLRACIYRMARKSAYLPHDLQISHQSIVYKRSLGAGAHGIATLAELNRKPVVIKKILCGDRISQKKCLEMFASEAILWKTLQHKNIVPFLGVVEEGFNLGLVSPFFKNGNIKECMRRYESEDWLALAWKWGRDLAQGLEYIHCHEPPIIHGDLKGDNVLVDDDGHARLGDFGQSHAHDSGKYLDSTRVGLADHIPLHWMAPELMGDERATVSDKSDVYSFGCVLYEILSGKIPFEGVSVADVSTRVLRGERPPRPTSIAWTDRFWNVVEACWRDHPNDRPSAASLTARLH